jgi:hypothetical protein
MGYTDNNGTYHAYHANILISLDGFRECDANGDVGAIAANGGILASDTTPILRGASGLIAQEISWATGNVDPIRCQVALPSYFDGRDDVLLDLWVSSGTTNAATFAVTSSWDAGATVTDSASDAATLSATPHRITCTISAADVPDGAAFVTILLTPPTHATDTIQLHSARIRHTERVTS